MPEDVRKLVIYSFPTRCRCPRCHSVETERYAGAGRFQYRRCQVHGCGFRFRVTGSPV